MQSQARARSDRIAHLAGGAFFSSLPAAAVAGAMALPVMICAAGAGSIRTAMRSDLRPSPAAVLALAFLAWACASSFWSPYPQASLQALKLVLLGLFGAAFVVAARASLLFTLAGGLAAFLTLAGLLAIEALWSMPLNRAAQPGVDAFELARNPTRGAILLLVLTWPSAAWLIASDGSMRRFAPAALLGVSAALSLPFGHIAHACAFALGFVVFWCAFARPRTCVLASAWGLAFWQLGAPFALPWISAARGAMGALPYSWDARIGVWSYVSDSIGERLLFGHGLEASRNVTDRIVVHGETMRAVPLHPHSASLQMWFETGAVGAVLASAALIAGGWELSRALAPRPAAAAAAAASIASLGFIANISYGLWQEWWLASLLIAAATVSAMAAFGATR